MRLRPFSRFSMIQLNGDFVSALMSRERRGAGGESHRERGFQRYGSTICLLCVRRMHFCLLEVLLRFLEAKRYFRGQGVPELGTRNDVARGMWQGT